MREQFRLRGWKTIVQGGPGDAAIGRIGVGQVHDAVALDLVHADGRRLTALLSLEELDRVADALGAIVEHFNATASPRSVTVQ